MARTGRAGFRCLGAGRGLQRSRQLRSRLASVAHAGATGRAVYGAAQSRRDGSAQKARPERRHQGAEPIRRDGYQRETDGRAVRERQPGRSFIGDGRRWQCTSPDRDSVHPNAADDDCRAVCSVPFALPRRVAGLLVATGGRRRARFRQSRSLQESLRGLSASLREAVAARLSSRLLRQASRPELPHPPEWAECPDRAAPTCGTSK